MNAALEDIDVLFETNPTWLIGPGSKRKLAKIIADRAENNTELRKVDLSKEKGHVTTVEQVGFRGEDASASGES